jgi:tetratricopeptide (TPR) repeat protein
MPVQQASLDALWNFENPVASEAALRRVAERVADPVEHAELQTQIARALGLQGRFDEAERMLARIPKHDPIVLTRIELERGRLLSSHGDPDAALPHFRRAIHAARKAGDGFLLIDALHMAAIVDTDHAERWFQEAMRELADIRDPRTQRWTIALCTNYGWHLHDAGRFAEALDAFRAAVTASLRLGTAEQLFVARWAEARCLRSLGRRAEALVLQQALHLERPDDEYVAAELAVLRAHRSRE